MHAQRHAALQHHVPRQEQGALVPQRHQPLGHERALEQLLGLAEQGVVCDADLAIERDWLGWLMAGEVQADAWYAPARTVDFFDLKGAVEDWLARMGLSARFVADDGMQGLQAGQSARIVVGRSEVGRIGRVHREVCDFYGIEVPVFVAEVQLGGLPAAKAPKFAALPEVPGSWRDLVFLFDRHVKAEDIVNSAVKAGGRLVTEARIFDRYTGKGVPEGKKSLAISVRLQPKDKTLTDAEIDAVAEKIVAAVTKATGGTLRA